MQQFNRNHNKGTYYVALIYKFKFLQVCEADDIDELITALEQLTSDLVLLTEKTGDDNSTTADDLMEIILLLEFIVK